MISPKTKLERLAGEISAGLFERDEALRLCLLAGIAGENVFLLGPPGTAKSLLCRHIKYAFEGTEAFEYLLNQFSTPDEIFGPLSIQKLKDEGKYERLTEGFLPGAGIVFLDEIWKAGSAVANSLLTAINEKIFRNGAVIEKLPLKLLVSASNETPKKDAGMDALWDRFLIRIPVSNIQDSAVFRTMLDAPEKSAEAIHVSEKITQSELSAWRGAANALSLNDYVFNFLIQLKENIAKRNAETAGTKPPIYVSDRRWRKTARLIKTAAFLNGRNEPDLTDCFLVIRCLWSAPEEINECAALTRSTMAEGGIVSKIDIENIRSELYALKTDIGETLVSIADERKEEPFLRNNYYFFTLNTGGTRGRYYIRREDYRALTPFEKDVMIYRQMASKTGYLNRARHQLYKNARSAFTHNDDDIEFFLVPEQKHAVKKDAAAKDGPFTFILDGETAALEVHSGGHIYRVSRAPAAEEKIRWEGRLRALEEFAAALLRRVTDYEYIYPLDSNLWTSPEDSALITAHISAVHTELKKIHLEIEETRNSFYNAKDERVVIDYTSYK